ncbi:chloride channel protein [Rhodovibrio sodomensis]|uniref:Chloride channel protein n=1 Tax=Rhodovibrio sodomensis TaxID=1088 RepID=A0ABS1DB92_9PROT|nr:chloride channel protein [Rhodovibrio sodomensis]MBK1667722.1 chloride channel protein [Rhodovibrio sodomensis]
MVDQNDGTRQVGLVTLTGLALLVGVVTGLGALAFRVLIAVLHNIFFAGTLDITYDAEALIPLGPWGPFVILVPVIGGMGVVWLTQTFAPEARGHGVPEVMDAIYHREGQIRPVVAIAKSLASALSIGSGAAVGREGPIIQIGSSFGSTMGQLTRLPTWQRITLLAAGGGAGIAATFNTPLGGVMFAIELMLPEVSSRTFLPVVIATAAATYIGRIFFGIDPAFIVPIAQETAFQAIDLSDLTGFTLLGLLCGLASFAFIRVLSLLEDFFDRFFKNHYLRHATGMLIVGTMMYLLAQNYGHYFIQGTGYGTISAVLHNELATFQLMSILFAAKLAATTLSLGSGASGGIFSPSLFMGTTLGAALAIALNWLPGFDASPPEFAMVGMAGVVGGASGAAMTAIVMVFEMTRDYNIIVPMVIAVALSIGVRRALSAENIYTIKLAWRGKHIPKGRHTNMFLVRHAAEVMDDAFAVLPAEMTLETALETLGFDTGKHFILVTDGDATVGVIRVSRILRSSEGVQTGATLGELASRAWVLAERDDILHDVLQRMSERDGHYAVVMPNGRTKPESRHVIGIVGKDRIADSVMQHFHT